MKHESLVARKDKNRTKPYINASLMLNHGVPVIMASIRLGHSKPSITLDIYGHLYQEMQDEVARKMDELVLPMPVGFQAEVLQPAPAMK